MSHVHVVCVYSPAYWLGEIILKVHYKMRGCDVHIYHVRELVH